MRKRVALSKKSPEFKQKKKEVNNQKILDNLYNLPLDVKIKICKMAMLNHIIEWKKEHKEKIRASLVLLNPNNISPPGNPSTDDEWNGWNGVDLWFMEDEIDADIIHGKGAYEYNMKVNTLCYKANPGWTRAAWAADYIIEDNEYNDIDDREWACEPGYFWTHPDCRCFKCDLVRVSHREKMCKTSLIDPTIQKKYARIYWGTTVEEEYGETIADEQWLTLSVKQKKNL